MQDKPKQVFNADITVKDRDDNKESVKCVTLRARLVAPFAMVMLLIQGCVGSSEQEDVSVRLGENPVVYVKRVTPLEDDSTVLMTHDLTELDAFYPGASLMLRAVASPNVAEQALTAGLFDEPIDIKDLSASYDGKRLLFALRAPEIEDADEDEQPTWNIWEYDSESGALRRVIANDLIAEEGQDMSPQYLPDGRILFVSTRQRQALARLLDEGRSQFFPQDEDIQNNAVALHVMNADGTNIRQVSFNLSHDQDPVIMADGRVLFSRWDNKENLNEFNFYSMRPDGTDTGILYGADSHVADDPAPIWWRPRDAGDGRVLVLKRAQQSGSWSGVPTLIRVRDFINATQPVVITGNDAEQAALSLPVAPDGEVSVAGRFAAVAPLNDGSNRYLAAWSPCRLVAVPDPDAETPAPVVLRPCTSDNVSNANLIEASPAYGLWIFDGNTGTQRPVALPQDGYMVTDVAVMASRTVPVAIADGEPGLDLSQSLADAGLGVIDIRSVYDLAGEFDTYATLPAGVTTLEQYRDPALVTADQRRVQFLRIIKGVLIPDDDVVELDAADFGRQALGMRELVGYVPVAPDGSVRARVPANVPIDIQLVDSNGRNILGRHGTWLSVRPGETLVCGGCHEGGSALPHGRSDAELPNINVGAEVTGLPFANTRPELFADVGDTMAQVLSRVQPETQTPLLELAYEDFWTDPAVRAPDASWSIDHADLDTTPPQRDLCTPEWNSLCRIIINYNDHIQPIWDAPRTVDDGGMMIDGQCSRCHNRRDAANALQVPEGQLELTGDPDGAVADNLVSYRELLFQDNEVALVDGALVDALTPVLDGDGNPVFEVDENGDPVLDGMGNPIPVEETTTINPPLVAGFMRAGRFVGVFSATGAHPGWLTEAEMRLISEWVDLGAQNYNDPFAVPQ